MKQEMLERFLTYVRFDTQSDDDSDTCPSTPGQLELARKLVEELKSIGMSDVTMDGNGYVMATLPSNTDKPVPVIGFLAHLDTATELSGANVNPQVIDAYDGRDIVLNRELGVVLSPGQFPELAEYEGHTLVTTDGTTLLGADDKAGIAEIMTAMAYLIRHPEIKHGQIRVAFTPDEEIGRGPHRFDVAAFGAKYAYTMDGGKLGELEYESFNAAEAKIEIRGKVVHPGYAKGKMINAIAVGMELHAKLPPAEVPELTEGYEGYFYLNTFLGSTDTVNLIYNIRDFDKERFGARKALLTEIVEELRKKYGEERITLTIKDQYFNMREKVEAAPEVLDVAKEALERLGIRPVVRPIRGGTDGSQLSYMGLPTPNLFAGGVNWHGRYEFASADTMLQAVNVIVEIAKLFEERA
ncbi:peptidase T [Cohnella caldifontis]|uniref:peptidase T n=1 Tax=Cohnella caldifontis TaxID=3027471 RepID=UPI0023EB02AC|nr:peptidase T [Cohnella sp. YIM B05605]